MDVHYELTLADLAAYQGAVKRRVVVGARATRRITSWLQALLLLSLYVALAALAVVFLPQITGKAFAEPEFFAGLGLGMSAVLAISWLDYRRNRRHTVRTGGPTLSPHTLNLEPGGLRFSGNNFENTYLWSIFESVEDAGAIIVLWIEPALGLTVPRRAFANEDEARHFLDRAREEITAAHRERAA
jgi:hypothetical protein